MGLGHHRSANAGRARAPGAGRAGVSRGSADNLACARDHVHRASNVALDARVARLDRALVGIIDRGFHCGRLACTWHATQSRPARRLLAWRVMLWCSSALHLALERAGPAACRSGDGGRRNVPGVRLRHLGRASGHGRPDHMPRVRCRVASRSDSRVRAVWVRPHGNRTRRSGSDNVPGVLVAMVTNGTALNHGISKPHHRRRTRAPGACRAAP